MLRQQAIFNRAIERRVRAAEKKQQHEQVNIVRGKAVERTAHDQHFRQLGDHHQPRFLELIGERAGQRGKKQQRQNEQRRANRRQNFGIERQRDTLRCRISDKHHEAGAQQVIVKRAKECREEQRQKPPFFKQAVFEVFNVQRFKFHHTTSNIEACRPARHPGSPTRPGAARRRPPLTPAVYSH